MAHDFNALGSVDLYDYAEKMLDYAASGPEDYVTPSSAALIIVNDCIDQLQNKEMDEAETDYSNTGNIINDTFRSDGLHLFMRTTP
ncbi:MAG: hypothetical protein PVG41_06520 [Desulfobacteraceae bacterium]|jgi:hypothetical protein